jgi:quinol monooxygenase YgiN
VPFVAVTRLHIRDEEFLPAFFEAAFASGAEAEQAEGNLVAEATVEPDGRTFWTRTVWTDRDAMRAFMRLPAHSAAMPSLREWCDEASVVNWVQDDARPPQWREAHERMQRDGRTSRVDHPSPAQEAFAVPAPDLPDEIPT